MSFLARALIFSVCVLCCNAEDIHGRIKLPHATTNQNFKVVLNGGQYWATTRTDGTFLFHAIPEGIYSLDVMSVSLRFPQIKLDVRSRTGSRIRALQYDYPGAPKRTIQYPLVLEPLQVVQYFEKRESIGLHTLFRNPMMIMAAVMLFFAVVMPKMMKNMDPEEMKRMQEEMGDNDPQKMISGLFGGGAKKDDDDEDD